MFADMKGPVVNRIQAQEADAGESLVQEGVLEFDPSMYQHLTLKTLSELSRTAEQYSNPLRHFPRGSKLLLSAEGERGNAWENGWLTVYAELVLPGLKQGSGKEIIYRNGSKTLKDAFKAFLSSLTGQKQIAESGQSRTAPAPRIKLHPSLLCELSGDQCDAIYSVIEKSAQKLAGLPKRAKLGLFIQGSTNYDGEYVNPSVMLELDSPSVSAEHEIGKRSSSADELARALEKRLDIFLLTARNRW